MPLIRDKENPSIIIDVLDYFLQPVKLHEPYIIQGTIGMFLKWNLVLMIGSYHRDMADILYRDQNPYLSLYLISNGTTLDKHMIPLPDKLHKEWMHKMFKRKVHEYKVCHFYKCPKYGQEELVNVFTFDPHQPMDYLSEREVKNCVHCGTSSSRTLYRLE